MLIARSDVMMLRHTPLLGPSDDWGCQGEPECYCAGPRFQTMLLAI